MSDKLELKDIILSNKGNIVESIVKLIEYKIMHEDLEEDMAIKETLDYLQIMVSSYGIKDNIEYNTDLLELVRVRYKDFKITQKLSNR